MRDERHLSFKARLENIPSACDFVAQAAETAGLDERGVYHCQLAVDEACTNIIEHGFATDPHGQINLMTGIEGSATFVVIIADNSPAFNPLTFEEPDPHMGIEDREGGGWGIYFIKKLMDVVDYRYVDGKNMLTLRKYIAHEAVPVGYPDENLVQVSKVKLDKNYLQINLGGQIDSHTSSQIEAVFNEEITHNQNYRLIVSFADVSYISSSGLKVLVSAWRRARQNGGDVLIADLQPRIREVFDMIGFDMMFNIYENAAAAVADDPIHR